MRTSLAVCLFVALLLRMGSLSGLSLTSMIHLSKDGILRWGTPGMVAMGLGLWAYFAFDMESKQGAMTSALIRVSVPLILAEALILAWSKALHPGPFLEIPKALVYASFIPVLGLWLAPYRLLPHGSRVRVGALAALGLGLLASLPGRWVRDQALGHPGTRDHRIQRVVVLVADALRADALSCEAGEGGRTPAMDALAQDGVLFEQAIASASWTLPSVYSMTTGVSPLVHEAVKLTSLLSPGFPTAPQKMQAQGYHTTAIVGSPLLFGNKNFARGFDDYFEPGVIDATSRYALAGSLLGQRMPDEVNRGRTAQATDASGHGQAFPVEGSGFSPVGPLDRSPRPHQSAMGGSAVRGPAPRAHGQVGGCG